MELGGGLFEGQREAVPHVQELCEGQLEQLWQQPGEELGVGLEWGLEEVLGEGHQRAFLRIRAVLADHKALQPATDIHSLH